MAMREATRALDSQVSVSGEVGWLVVSHWWVLAVLVGAGTRAVAA
jgi:hypothetical protein